MATTKVRRLVDGKHCNYLGDHQSWWFDPSFPHSFEIFDLDVLYDEEYFAEDHVSPEGVKNFCDLISEHFQAITQRPLRSVLELGCAGGWHTLELLNRGIEVSAVEGVRAGYNTALRRGVPPSVVTLHDLRKPLDLQKRFDLVICTEVAEHIEPPFAAVLVSSMVRHADLVWFSFEEPDTNEAAYDHTNEMPLKYWRNLFRFFDFDLAELSEADIRKSQFRGRLICYRSGLKSDLERLAAKSDVTVLPEPAESLQPFGAEKDRLKRRDRRLKKIQNVLPPFLYNRLDKLLKKTLLPQKGKDGQPYTYTNEGV